MDVLARIRTVPDFPKPGIMFKDITTLLSDAESFGQLMREMADRYRGKGFTHIAGVESRGFIFGAALAQMIGAGFVPVRKAGKLPFATISRSYALEYGSATLEVHNDAFPRGAKVLMVDDVLATGGTLRAAVDLVRELGAEVPAAWVLLELAFLNPRKHFADLAIHAEGVVDSE